MLSSTASVPDRRVAAARRPYRGERRAPPSHEVIRFPRGPLSGRGAAAAAETPQPAEGGAASELLMRMLDEVNHGLMLVGESARVHYANHMALRECASNPALELRDGHLHALRRSEQEALVKALAAACAGRRSLLNFDVTDAPVSLAVVPMSGSTAVDDEVVALLVFGKRRLCEPLSVEFFAQAYQLSAAERTVLGNLCNGLSPVQTAKQVGVAISTVRTQIGSIRLKTQAQSIAQVVRMVTMLPPTVPALGRLSWARCDQRQGAMA